jgi:hypothetical protein
VGKNLTFEVFKITPVGKHRFYPWTCLQILIDNYLNYVYN